MNEEPTLFNLPPPADLKVAEIKFRERNPIWTGCKSKLIERYLYYFVLITHTGTYMDAFAGPQEPDKQEMWSAKLVLESVPRWLKSFFLFEKKRSQVGLIERMRNSLPPRDIEKREPKRIIEIFPGDFNRNIAKMLNEHPIGDKDPTFCLLDQRTFECDWKSVETIASHKKGGNKIELFYFFPEGWINRSIAAKKIDKDEALKRWWGNSDWTALLNIQGAIRAQYVSDRFKSDLNYKYAYPFPIYEKKDGQGRVMYYMIHATDHDEAPRLMNRAYGKALDLKETAEQLDFLNDPSFKV